MQTKRFKSGRTGRANTVYCFGTIIDRLRRIRYDQRRTRRRSRVMPSTSERVVRFPTTSGRVHDQPARIPSSSGHANVDRTDVNRNGIRLWYETVITANKRRAVRFDKSFNNNRAFSLFNPTRRTEACRTVYINSTLRLLFPFKSKINNFSRVPSSRSRCLG